MNFQRLAMAAVVGYVVDMMYGFLVFGLLLADRWMENPVVFRGEETSLVPGFISSFVGAFVFAYVYVKGYEGTNGVQEGLRFGVLVGLLMVCYGIVWQYVTVRISGATTMTMAIATIVEFVILGTVVGTLYRPAGPGIRKAAL